MVNTGEKSAGEETELRGGFSLSDPLWAGALLDKWVTNCIVRVVPAQSEEGSCAHPREDGARACYPGGEGSGHALDMSSICSCVWDSASPVSPWAQETASGLTPGTTSSPAALFMPCSFFTQQQV